MSQDQSGNSDLQDNIRTNRGATLGPFDYIFLGYRLGIRNDSNTFHQYFMASSTLTANRLLTLPEVDSDDTIVGRASNDTITGIKTINNYVVMDEQSAPSAPDADTIRLYAKDNGSGTTELFYKNSGGSERDLSSTGSGGGGGGASYIDDLLDVAISAVSDGDFLRYNSGSGLWENQALSTTHALLSATHTDTAAQTVSRGSLIYGNSTPAWDELVIGSSNKVIASDGTDAAWTTLTLSHLPATVLNNTQDNSLGAHYFDVTRITAPSNPSANDGRVYVKQIDGNNDGVFVKIKRAGSFTEVQIV